MRIRHGCDRLLRPALLLGAAEAGFFPGMIYIDAVVSTVLPRALCRGVHDGAARVFIVGAPLSTLVLGLDGTGGLHGCSGCS